MKRIGIMMAALMAMIAVSGTAVAQPGPRGPHGPHGKPGDQAKRMAHFLQLTDEQKAQMKELHEKFREENKATIDQMKQLHQQAREQMQNGDREGAKETRDQLRELRASMKDEHMALRDEMKSILTEEQLQKLETMKERRGEHCRGHKGKGPKGDGNRPEVAPQTEHNRPDID
jgi:Spy/CpxP family protein refolding chaperone